VPGALVLGGDYRALGVVRSLGRRGIPVEVVREEADHRLAALSRYSRGERTFPAADDAVRRELLLDLAHRRGREGWVLFPTADATAAFVAREHAALASSFRLTTPPWEVFRWAYDKRRTADLARSLGMPSPATLPAPTRADAAAYRGPFPVLVKPATKPFLNRPAAKAWPAADADALLRAYDEAAAQTEPGTLVLQELVPGGQGTQFSFAALCDDGRTLVEATAERVRQHPPDLGRSSTFVQTVEAPEVADAGRRVLAELRLTGIAEVEFKRDARDGSYRLLDVNLRVWGWHTLGRRAGIDFAHLAWRTAVGETVAPAIAPPGLRWLRLTTDVAAGGRLVASGELSAAAWLRSLGGRHEAPVAAWDDPLPGLAEIPLFLAPAVAGRWNSRVTRPGQQKKR
jgi:predicted ATP-grasp superfamily ATP-dependent carboligase